MSRITGKDNAIEAEAAFSVLGLPGLFPGRSPAHEEHYEEATHNRQPSGVRFQAAGWSRLSGRLPPEDAPRHTKSKALT